MNTPALRRTVCCIALTATAAGAAWIAPAFAGDREPPAPNHFTGLINDYTPSNAVVAGGTYEMRGKWTLDVDTKHGTAAFTAAMNMETSDYGITQGTVDKDSTKTRGQHTHHIVMTDGVVTDDWTSCQAYKPAVTGGFVVRGTAFVTGNGGPAPFGNPSTLTICVVGGAAVKYSNMEMVFGPPASGHFGTLAVHGVVLGCSTPWFRESRDCAIQE